jgi:hypothetical protein
MDAGRLALAPFGESDRTNSWTQGGKRRGVDRDFHGMVAGHLNSPEERHLFLTRVREASRASPA